MDDAERYLAERPPLRERFARVARLVEEFETPFGLELLATVHWVMAEEGRVEDSDIEAATYAWAARKRAFSSAQIRLAAERLRHEGWFSSATTAD